MFSFSLYEPGLRLKFFQVFRLKLQTEFQLVLAAESPVLHEFWVLKKIGLSKILVSGTVLKII